MQSPHRREALRKFAEMEQDQPPKRRRSGQMCYTVCVVKFAVPLGPSTWSNIMKIATASENDNFQSGNSKLLIEYRKALIEAYEIGESIKEVYGIIPPKVITEHIWKGGNNPIVVGLTVN